MFSNKVIKWYKFYEALQIENYMDDMSIPERLNCLIQIDIIYFN